MAFTSGTPPWRRAPAGSQLNEKVVSVEEDIPKLSANAPEFVPCLQQASMQYSINLDDYTDDESSSEAESEKDASGADLEVDNEKVWIPASGNVINVEPFAEPSPTSDASDSRPEGWLPPWKRGPPITARLEASSMLSVDNKQSPWRLPRRRVTADEQAKDTDTMNLSSEDQAETVDDSPVVSEFSECSSEPEAEEGPSSQPQGVAFSTASGSLSMADMFKWRAAASTARDPNVSYTSLLNAEEVMPQQRRTRTSTEQHWRPPSPTTEECLEVSDNSWALQQRVRRATVSAEDDAAAVRKVKSLLNKLTVENFERLYTQLVDGCIGSVRHVEVIIQEVIDKATQQHHFIDMYAELCVQLNEGCAVRVDSVSNTKLNFKRLLLNACQTSFDQALKPPAGLHLLYGEERTEAEVKYKLRMLGNIRFVGALLARRMLASKVFIGILEELLNDPTTEALEAAAALLTSAGFAFDKPEWTHHTSLVAIFAQLENFVHRPKACVPRVRFLLRDVLELRARGWDA